MKRIIYAIFILFPALTSAQNWQNICRPGITFYADTTSEMSAFRLDSLQVSPTFDTTYYSYRTIRDSLQGSGCSDTSHGSVLGFRVILTHDGWCYFFNRFGDTLKILTTAGLNQFWRFCSLPGGNYIEATVSTINTEQVLGQSDQVKIVNLQARNSAGAAITHPLNQAPFKLSQNHGLVSFYDVYHLPGTVKTCNLVGTSVPPLGLQDFNWRDVYDFAVGDEFHYEGYINDMTGSAYWKMIQVILGKTVYGNHDSVDYVTERCKQTVGAPPPDTIFGHDTVTIRYNFLTMDSGQLFMSLPDEMKSQGDFSDKYMRRNGDYNDRQVKSIGNSYYANSIFIPGCWSVGLWEYSSVSGYSPGLGRTEYFTLEMWWGEGYDLVYFKKGGETWGTPVASDCSTLTRIETHRNLPSFLITPNPASDMILVQIPGLGPGEKIMLKAYDVMGREKISVTSFSNDTRINTSELQPGSYILIGYNESGKQLLRGRFVVIQ